MLPQVCRLEIWYSYHYVCHKLPTNAHAAVVSAFKTHQTGPYSIQSPIQYAPMLSMHIIIQTPHLKIYHQSTT